MTFIDWLVGGVTVNRTVSYQRDKAKSLFLSVLFDSANTAGSEGGRRLWRRRRRRWKNRRRGEDEEEEEEKGRKK